MVSKIGLKSFGHGFHLVESSPWPILTAVYAFCIAVGLVEWFSGSGLVYLLIGLFGLGVCTIFWWRDVIRESTFQGHHTSMVQRGIKAGFVLFLLSEAAFFLSLFWAFFHAALVPTAYLGNQWPPTGIQAINPWTVPLLNTAVLVGSGVSVTLSHHSVRAGSLLKAKVSLLVTVMMGLYFTWLQWGEYRHASYTMADSVFGSTFYLATGFHGLHVIVGTLFLATCLYRMQYLQFSTTRHLGYSLAIWYWHFVDAVWILLYGIIYIWGSW
uniref:Cytochrome c oxidase subunit 3 n=1 Tax=Laternula truncata TaxID=1199070 RepID=A0A1U9XPK7_9BIVA|nr:cytochrome c oxidase subunit III [Laternula truncata]AQZ26189.1 cytochrome c oxidase subunit III [Laternula truncata]